LQHCYGCCRSARGNDLKSHEAPWLLVDRMANLELLEFFRSVMSVAVQVNQESPCQDRILLPATSL
jgi:hypothetical protein